MRQTINAIGTERYDPSLPLAFKIGRAALRESFERERDRGAGRNREAIAPYARFVRGERSGLEEASAALARIGDGLEGLGGRVAAFGCG